MKLFTANRDRLASYDLSEGRHLARVQIDRFSPRSGYPILLGNDLRPVPLLSDYLQHISGALEKLTVWQYAYDLRLFGEFLETVGLTADSVTHRDIAAFRRIRTETAEHPISSAAWNRTASVLRGLFEWMQWAGHTVQKPWIENQRKNSLSSRPTRAMDIRHLTLDQYRVFINQGVRGLLPGGTADLSLKVQNTARLYAGADIARGTGMRRQEFSSLLLAEVLDPVIAKRRSSLELHATAKNKFARTVFITETMAERIRVYCKGERALHVASNHQSLAKRHRNLLVIDQVSEDGQQMSGLLDNSRITKKTSAFTLEERKVMVEEGASGLQSMALFVTRNGTMTRPAVWSEDFNAASLRMQKYSNAFSGHMPLHVTPHMLRHTFAVHMLAFFSKHLAEMNSKRHPKRTSTPTDLLRYNPLLRLQTLLGHASPQTTLHYVKYVGDMSATLEDAWPGWDDPASEFADYSNYLRGEDA